MLLLSRGAESTNTRAICHVEVGRDVPPQVCKPDPSAALGVTASTPPNCSIGGLVRLGQQ
jgi:hypothetical protein